ncbi:DCD (development and cell death) domain protein [Medicago truncatula]|uniref:DCD (Development and cell death) domain protein n=2 Tax=Medicago truncatula TaxID=3880 RepID=G7KU34_MEDTR|nr:DCD (development and cell death) domain protein [Medicago truncatula]
MSSSSGNQLYSPSPNQSYGRNLSKEQLGGVIFGTKNSTINECLTKQLFGLPAQHFAYVKNICPGLPLFLFNYTDRTLQGIFEAAGPGRMFIDQYGWSADSSEVTRFPAQVQIRVQSHCRPMSEDKFKHIIADNYYHLKHFWFELDHGQTNQLIALLKHLEIIPANSVPQNTNRVTASRPLPQHCPTSKVKTFQMPESELEEYHSTRSSMKSGSNKSDLFDECFQPLDPSWENSVCGTSYANENWSEGKHSEKEESPSSSLEKWENPSSPFEKWENPSSPLEEENTNSSFERDENTSSPLEHQYNIAQFVQELTDFKKTQAERNNYLEQKLITAELKIQLLKDRCTLLESTRKAMRIAVKGQID